MGFLRRHQLSSLVVVGFLVVLAETATTDIITGTTTLSYSETPSYSDDTTEYMATTDLTRYSEDTPEYVDTTDFTSSSLASISTISSTSSSAAPSACYLPFEDIGGRCLYVDPLQTGSWYDMRLFCSRLGEGAHLAILDDADILRAVIQYIKQFGLDHSHYWLGASDEEHETVWKWNDGTDVGMGAPFWKYDCNSSYQYKTNQEFPLRPQIDPDRNCAALDSGYHFLMADFPCLGDGGLVPFAPICQGPLRSDESVQ